MRIYANRWFAKFRAKEMISDAPLADAVHRVESCLIDADLGGGLIKQRITRQGGGQVWRLSLDPDLPLGRAVHIRVRLR